MGRWESGSVEVERGWSRFLVWAFGGLGVFKISIKFVLSVLFVASVPFNHISSRICPVQSIFQKEKRNSFRFKRKMRSPLCGSGWETASPFGERDFWRT